MDDNTNHISHIECTQQPCQTNQIYQDSLNIEKDKAFLFTPHLRQMASLGRFSYQRLRNEGGYDDDDYNKRRVIIRRAKSWSRFRRVSFRKRFKLKIPSLRRFMKRRAKVVFLSLARISKRLKEGQSHFGDLFAGNYLFMQVTPTPMKCVEKSWKGPPQLHGYPLQRIA